VVLPLIVKKLGMINTFFAPINHFPALFVGDASKSLAE
jgi:hypothetical protein